MNRPPDAEKAAPQEAAPTDNQPELTIQNIADEAANVNNADEIALYVDAEHQRAPQALVDRFNAAAAPVASGSFRPRLARVRFEKHRFYFDPEGQWAVVAPIFEKRQIVNWGAFAVDDDSLRRTFSPGHFAVGLENAAWNARVHPQRRLLVLFSVWEWLRCGCAGVLPVNWKATAIHILQEGYELHGDPIDDAVTAEVALANALKLPPMYPRNGDEP